MSPLLCTFLLMSPLCPPSAKFALSQTPLPSYFPPSDPPHPVVPSHASTRHSLISQSYIPAPHPLACKLTCLMFVTSVPALLCPSGFVFLFGLPSWCRPLPASLFYESTRYTHYTVPRSRSIIVLCQSVHVWDLSLVSAHTTQQLRQILMTEDRMRLEGSWKLLIMTEMNSDSTPREGNLLSQNTSIRHQI